MVARLLLGLAAILLAFGVLTWQAADLMDAAGMFPSCCRRRLSQLSTTPRGSWRAAPDQLYVMPGNLSRPSYVVSWVMPGPPAAGARSRVTFGAAPAAPLPHAAEAPPAAFRDLWCGSVRSVHSVELVLPDPTIRRWYYQVSSASGAAAPTQFFDTLPAAGASGFDQQEMAAGSSDQAERGVSGQAAPQLRCSSGIAQVGCGRPLTVSLFGDLGAHYASTAVPQLLQRTRAGLHDLVLHVGDIGYNLHSSCGRVGDAFMAAIAPSAARTPWLWAPGNHEADALFTYHSFLARFAGQAPAAAASKAADIRQFSVDVGLVHFAFVDTDVYIFPPAWPRARAQWAWLQADLAAVDRAATPWVVVLGHRALYCTKTLDWECTLQARMLREGVPLVEPNGLERLLTQHKVDLYVAGHTHHYQRSWPVVQSKPVQRDYTNPGAPVYVVSGIAGVNGQDKFWMGQAAWESVRDDQEEAVPGCGAQCLRRSFGELAVHNCSHLTYRQLAAEGGTVIDSFTLVHSSRVCQQPAGV